MSSWQKSCGNIGFSLLASRSFLLALKMTSSPNMLRERYDLYCLWKPFQHNCGLFFSFSNLLASPRKGGKSLIFLLSSKNNTSWQVIQSVKCYSLKRENLPEWCGIKIWTMKYEKIPFCYVYLNIISVSQGSWTNTNKQSLSFFFYITFKEGRVEDGCSCELKSIRPQRFWGLLSTAVLI